MKKWMVLLGVSLVFLFLFSGCEKNSSSVLDEQALEETELREFVLDEQNEYLLDWGIDDGDEQSMFDGFSTFGKENAFSKVMAPINNVVRFGRKIDERFPRTIIIRRVSPDTVKVFVERVLVGKFVIFEKINADTTDPDTLALYRKPLRHIVQRNAVFVKRAPNTTPADQEVRRGRWKLHSISLSKGSSPQTTIRIAEVTVYTSSGDTLRFTNPLDTQLLVPEGLPTFQRGETVTVQVKLENTTSNPVVNPNTGATETVLLHYGRSIRDRARKRFEFVGTDPSGLHIYEGTWTVREPARRPYHAIVDAIDNGTIYDNDPVAYPYNSVTWGTPYRVVIFK